MTQPMPEPEPIPEPEPRFEIEISPEIEPGVHADFASIWHTPDTFVLDFASLRRPPFLSQDDETDNEVLILPTRIVARVKIPSSPSEDPVQPGLRTDASPRTGTHSLGA